MRTYGELIRDMRQAAALLHGINAQSDGYFRWTPADLEKEADYLERRTTPDEALD